MSVLRARGGDSSDVVHGSTALVNEEATAPQGFFTGADSLQVRMSELPGTRAEPLIPIALEASRTVHVARQPILSRSRAVFGYELLYRSGIGATACTAPVDLAGARVMSDAMLTLGLDTLTGGLPAFVNLTRQLLVSDCGTLLPRGRVVLELLEDIPADATVIDACRRLHQQGYQLALDDFVAGSDAEALLPYARFVKVDVLATPAQTRAALAKRLVPRGLRLIAEKVETAEIAKHLRAFEWRRGPIQPNALQVWNAPRQARSHRLCLENDGETDERDDEKHD